MAEYHVEHDLLTVPVNKWKACLVAKFIKNLVSNPKSSGGWTTFKPFADTIQFLFSSLTNSPYWFLPLAYQR